ncbi:sporulation inhibitor KapD [uncultured Clostridium sp.]|uniref:3'-5' exonuclease n=1 Tax=uncultured Clostridium sp. TaxID=59620 RepID=UPI000821220C|nr:3'-5' exonuclease [uncultured Clostridium sp.]SCI73366.1 sporulation inhibitor KapD [uncultured Clostridium sp.]
MNYIIFDLEFNQQHPDIKNDQKPELMFEIIQIGAVKLDNNFNTISTFNSFVKPTVHKILHPYVEELTNITYEQINTSKVFIDVYEDFINFIGDHESTLVLWGVNDIKELIKNAHYYKLSSDAIPKKYIDIQCYLSKALKYSKGKKIGLKTAIEYLEISIDSEFHDAFNDAYYTTEVFKKVYNKKVKPQLYIYTENKREKSQKTNIDTSALIGQFEKMYNRSMTDEEKSMIKVAYMMGKTNQFNK